MKILTLLLALATATPLLAVETKPELPKPICCRESLPPAKYSERSVYRLDSTWTSDFGKPVKLALLRGRPVVLLLFFTNCEHSCPLMLKDLKELESKLPRAVRERTDFVLVTIDPKHDTVPVLKAYRDKNDLPADRWLLLRGGPKAVEALADHLGFKYVPGSETQFAHSLMVTILNPAGEIVFRQEGMGVDRREAVKTIQRLAVSPRATSAKN